MDPLSPKRIRISGDSRVSIDRSTLMENQIKLLKNQITELEDENLALRENNIRFQIENFKLQRKLKQYESNSMEESIIQMEIPSFQQSQKISTPQKQNQTQSSTVHEMIIEEFIDETEYEALNESVDQQESVSSQSSDLKALKVYEHFNLKQRQELEKVKTGAKFDSKFVYKLLLMLFDKETLITSSVTGRPSKNTQFDFKGAKVLDKGKMNVCKRLLAHRIDKEDVLEEERDDRMKKLNFHINNKIQNLRKFVKESPKTS